MRASFLVGLFVLVSTVGAIEVKAQGDKFARLPVVTANQTSQTMVILEGHLNLDPVALPPGQLAVVDGSALVPESIGAGDTYADAGLQGGGQIYTYIVRKGDNIATIAKMFGVSANTIVWANDLKSSNVAVGQELVILPISGVKHTVVKGDTPQSIAKKYGADASDILSFNGLSSTDKLALGQVIIVPDGELGTSLPASSGSAVGGSKNTCGLLISNYERLLVSPCKYPSYPDYYIRPIVGGRKTQNLHGYNAVDFGAPLGTPVMAASDGIVIIARFGGWNGGYGSYIVVSHDNGTQTLYGHLSAVNVTLGAKVSQGQVIGRLGNTGKSTGPHLHFEVRGARNPF